MVNVVNGGRSAAKGSNRVYIGRGTDYGNPFRVGIDGTRDEVIAKYKAWLEGNVALQRVILKHLPGKTLVCHCKPLACHGDVIAEYLSRFEPEPNLNTPSQSVFVGI